MRKPLLNDDQKVYIVYLYTQYVGRWTQEELGAMYNVSRRTIQRALLEQGVPSRYHRTNPTVAAVSPVVSPQRAAAPSQAVLDLDTPKDSYIRTYLLNLPLRPFYELFRDIFKIKQQAQPHAS